jgi:hypothetical protein
MNKGFCPRDCEHLSITEEQQQLQNRGNHTPHICLKYDTKLFHLLAHPDLYRCEKCYEENKE